MNIDGRNFISVNKKDINNDYASVQGDYVESPKGIEAFFDDEKKIKEAELTTDAYDRVAQHGDRNEQGEMAVSSDVIRELTDVVTPENYSKYEELGLEPDKDDPTNILTVSERIDIELATYCEDYRPVGEMNIKDLEQVYGDAGRVYAANISRKMSEYLLVNDMPITQENIYKAQYSVGGAENENKNCNQDKLSDEEWEELKPQIEKMFSNNGIEISDRNLENAKWLVEVKIPVTPGNICQLGVIDSINSSGEYYDNVAFTSMEAREIIENGTEEQITTLVLDNAEVTLLNMKRIEEEQVSKGMEYRNKREAGEEKTQKLTDKQNQKIKMSMKNLEELRLKMTLEASVLMMKKGIQVETTPLSQLVEELRKAETEYAQSIFTVTGNTADVTQVEQFLNTTTVMKQFASTPSYVMGDVLQQNILFQVDDMTNNGVRIERELQEARKAYDTLGTKPDKTLGDTLNKAFGNIDSILADMGEDVTSDNQRAVRILAYNQMEITSENVRAINEMDMQVTRLIDNLTPRTTAYLIANGINPLRTNIGELNEQLDEINEQIGVDSVEKYSEFLWKLDRNQAISDEDRDAYIGIYRLIHMIEKGDRRAIGAVARQGQEMTMRNLLTAVRNLKRTGYEVVVDDEYGIAEDVKLSDSNIDKQLMQLESSSFLKRAKDMISPENIRNTFHNVSEGMDTSLQEFVNKLAWESRDNAEEKMEYNRLRCDELHMIQTISEETLMNMAEDGMTKNMENMLGVSYYILNGGKTFSKIQSVCDEEEIDKDIEKLESVLDSDEGEDELRDKIDRLNVDVKDVIVSKSQIPVEDVRRISKVVDYVARAAEERTYYVPADIQGQRTTIKITLNAGVDEKGKVDVRIHRNDSEKDIQTQIDIKHGDVKVLVSADEEDIRNMEQLKERFKGELYDMKMNLKSFDIMKETMPVREKEECEVSNQMLFKIAKVWISCVKNCLEQTDN